MNIRALFQFIHIYYFNYKIVVPIILYNIFENNYFASNV